MRTRQPPAEGPPYGMHDRGWMNLTKPDQMQGEELTDDDMELSHLNVFGGKNDEIKWDEDTEHSSGNSWGVWLFLGCREILKADLLLGGQVLYAALKNANNGFISSNCDAENGALISDSSLPSILSCTSSSLIPPSSSIPHHFATTAGAGAPLPQTANL